MATSSQRTVLYMATCLTLRPPDWLTPTHGTGRPGDRADGPESTLEPAYRIGDQQIHRHPTSRLNSKVGQPKLAAYCASKFGLVGFAQALAMKLAPAGINVNTICPGPVDTERVDHFGRREDGTYDEARRAARIRQLSAETPLGRLATPKDVADLTAFLASDQAEYITGQAINLVGGLIMH